MDFFCTNCGSINYAKHSLQCSVCQAVLTESEYFSLMDYSNHVFRYGWLYRRFYENQFKQMGKINSYPSLWAPTNVTEIIIAAILGNASWDVIKFIASQVFNYLSLPTDPVKRSQEFDELHTIFSDDEHLKTFIRYVNEYHDDLPLINKKIADAIDSEIKADIMGRLSGAYYKNHSILSKQFEAPSQEEIRNMLRKADNEKDNHKINRPSQNSLNDLST